MQGHRLPDGTPPHAPGEYAWMPYADGLWPSTFIGEGEWHVVSPDGCCNALARVERVEDVVKPANHTVVIHEDGSISASPSLVMTSGWHGYLTNGVFT